MFILLLIITFIIALAVSYLIVRMFSVPIDNILNRIISDTISNVWSKYIRFAIYVTGISSGVRIWQLEKYITAPQTTENSEIVTLNLDRWVLEIYRTVIGTLQGIAWMLLVFFIFALIAYVIIRAFELKSSNKKKKK